jgi:lytic murein transglycosylase B
VPASVIVGIVGVETFYGRITGGFRVLDALATLSFDFPSGRSDRSTFFRGELEQFLLMCQRQQPMDCSEVKGSYAGAIGLPQFMPSSINKHAVDFDGDGRIDLTNSGADVVGSVAHFLAESGWERGQATHFAVSAPVDTRERALLLGPDILPSFTAAEFAAHGAVLSPEGQAYPGLLALVELQNGDAAPSYIAGTQNFYAVTRYNWSSYYALAVIELGQAVERARAAAIAGPLRLVSWNAEWLADRASLDSANFWTRCSADASGNATLGPELPVCDAYRRYGIHDGKAYEERKLAPTRGTLADLAAQGLDVLAVQEVQNAAALQAVLPPGYRVACTTTRHSPQNLAFVVREALAPVASCREVPALSLEQEAEPHQLRRGLELTVARGRGAVVLLNIHLKAGCATGRMDNADNAACATLQRQVPALEAWVEAQANTGHAFAIVGDFNRDLEAEIRGSYPARTDGSDAASPLTDPAQVRNLWPEVNDLSPPTSAMDLALVDRNEAHGHHCASQLDQLALSVLLRGQLDPRSLDADGHLPAQLLPRRDGASDHCPLRAELVFR